jgi:hypothetical protein
MLLVVSMLTFFVATSFTYAYFDNLTIDQFETVPVGDWQSGAVYYTGFENYTGGTGIRSIDGKQWTLTRTVVGNNPTNDNYNDTRSLRMQDNSSLVSVDSYKGADFISFYYGQAKDAKKNAALTLTATINGTTTVTLINNVDIPITWTQISFDLSYFYTTGVNGTVFTKDATVTFSFNFAGKNKNQHMNLDDIVINYEE